jgi:hypothetical protein
MAFRRLVLFSKTLGKVSRHQSQATVWLKYHCYYNTCASLFYNIKTHHNAIPDLEKKSQENESYFCNLQVYRIYICSYMLHSPFYHRTCWLSIHKHMDSKQCPVNNNKPLPFVTWVLISIVKNVRWSDAMPMMLWVELEPTSSVSMVN